MESETVNVSAQSPSSELNKRENKQVMGSIEGRGGIMSRTKGNISDRMRPYELM